MSRYLTSFSGKAGDILWSLPTVRAVSQLTGGPVDFCCMPQYKSLLPLLEYQPYIGRAFVVEDWKCTGSPHGDQPWKAPSHVESGYEKVWHLGYRKPPDLPLIDFTAVQAGVELKPPVLPFLEAPECTSTPAGEKYVACGFNPGYKHLKERFRAAFDPGIKVVDTETVPWLEAASLIKHAVCFVGCRSSNAVLAHGVNQQALIYEPDLARSGYGRPWWRRVVRKIVYPLAPEGTIFRCPYGRETIWPYNKAPEEIAAEAAEIVRTLLGR